MRPSFDPSIPPQGFEFMKVLTLLAAVLFLGATTIFARSAASEGHPPDAAAASPSSQNAPSQNQENAPAPQPSTTTATTSGQSVTAGGGPPPRRGRVWHPALHHHKLKTHHR